MTILFVRHGESMANVDTANLLDQPNHLSPLSDKGWEQARRAGIFVNDFYKHNAPKSPVRLWVSPFVRATQTALGMMDTAQDVRWDVSRRGEIMQFDDRLRERETTYFEGYSHDENAARHPEQTAYYKRVLATQGGRYYARPFGGENFADLSLRIHSVMQDLYHDIERGITEHVIVSHGNMMMVFMLAITKAHPFCIDAIKQPPNTSIRLFDMDAVSGRYEDFGYVYNPEDDTYLLDKPMDVVRRDLGAIIDPMRRPL